MAIGTKRLPCCTFCVRRHADSYVHFAHACRWCTRPASASLWSTTRLEHGSPGVPARPARWRGDAAAPASSTARAATARVARAFNTRLGRLCRDLRAELANSTVACVDMYAVKYSLFANHTAHGFSDPLTACCGSGNAPYNYEAGKACGSPKVKACADGDRRISWDGLHYTEAANRIVADKVLSAE
ncbi:GDSL esterase/lipase At1g09390-like [Miscanthus floridulus]|uniref:GDSL esterase/lipase At1g09390-like n=1 Tax=Miscanthus floridulus TaxID=154761 RepID=UPI00345874E7